MTTLYGRSWNITIGDTEVSSSVNGVNSLACTFSVRKTLKAEPNTCTLAVYNLSADSRRKFTSPKSSKIRIEAGYGERLTQLYLGDVRALTPGERRGADIVTELTSGDGEKAIGQARLSVPIGAKTPAGDALQAIARALGVGQGNVAKARTALASKGVTVFARGTVLTGNVARALTDFCRSAGLEWSIQDGAIQILDIGQGLETRPYVLSASTGLVNAPKVSSDGKVSAETLMLPDLRPGMRVQFDSLSVTGLYRVIEAEYQGETHGAAWGIRITCEKPKG